jgi:putative transposase
LTSEELSFELTAFVFMPEHVHLLLLPKTHQCDIARLLQAIKRPFSHRIKRILTESGSTLLDRLTVPDNRKGKVFRFWQKGPGYDRNLFSPKAVQASIDYIHHNPVKRGLCERTVDWKWSSARWFAEEGLVVDQQLPRIEKIPLDFFLGSK